MDLKERKKSLKETFKFISTVISWTIFTLLMICAALLLYYFVASKFYAIKGGKNGEHYEPKFSLYTIVSPSMVPNINVYDVIVNTRVDSPKDIKIGDVITFTSTSTETMNVTITHRVVSIIQDAEGNYSYQTKGDNNLIEDSSSVPYSNVIGRVSLRIPGLGRIQLFVASLYGWLCLILIPTLYIIITGFYKALVNKGIINEKGRVHKFLNQPVFARPKLLPVPKIIEEEPENLTPPISNEGITTMTLEDLFQDYNKTNQIDSQPTTDSSIVNNLQDNENQAKTSKITHMSIEDMFSNDDE